VVSSTPRPHFTPGKDPVPILQEAGWAPGPVWTGAKSRPHWDSIPDRPARSQSLYQLSHPAHNSLKWSVLFRTTHPKPASIPFFPIHATRPAHLIAPINSLSAIYSNTLIPSSAPCPLNLTVTHTKHVQENCYPTTACSHRYMYDMLVQKYPVIRCGNCGDKWKENGTIRRPNKR